MPAAELLETFPNPYPGRDYEIRLDCNEFTSMCPLGGIESDAAELALSYCLSHPQWRLSIQTHKLLGIP